MPAPLCTPAEVAESLGVDAYIGAEEAMVTRQCAAVSAMIRARRPLIDVWLMSGEVSPDIVLGIACQAVARVLITISTGGVGLRSEQHPEYSYELTASAAAGLNLTKAELALLTPAAGRARPFSVQPS